MRAFVAVTDKDWFKFLRARPDLDEVNFWQPSGGRRFRAIDEGELFLFKLHYPEHAIVGGGIYLWSTSFPFPIAWEAFEEKNGAASIAEMRTRIERYRKTPIEQTTHEVGCLVISQPFFLDEPQWIPPPPDWRPNIVQGKTYDLETFAGQRLWEQVQEAISRTEDRRAREVVGPMFGNLRLVRQRLGQGSFRILVTDAYERRCAVTGERALPVLEASHIQPVAEGGSHRVDNGVLLRSDVHTLFDRGYVTITPDEQFRVSSRLRKDFNNGEAYYALDRRDLWLPRLANDHPASEFLEWHNDTIFLH